MKTVLRMMGLSLAFGAVILSGCASRQVVHERGWIGGEYVGVVPTSKILFRRDWGRIVQGFPSKLRPEYSGGILVSDVRPNTPIAQAGLQEGDLILRVNGQMVEKLKTLRYLVDNAKPGSRLTFAIYRDGAITEQSITVGKESYREEHVIQVAVGFSTTLQLDLIPDPTFSLLAVGHERKQDRLELGNAETSYLQSLRSDFKQPTESDAGVVSTEGWRTWLGIFSVGGHKKIVAQEPASSVVAAPSTEADKSKISF
jgi:hypothetical protein